MGRGRPKKEELTVDELQAKANAHQPMTLYDAAKLMATRHYEVVDPQTGERRILEPKKYSVMGLQKLEQRIFAKIRSALSELGIESTDDIFEPKFQSYAKATSTREY